MACHARGGSDWVETIEVPGRAECGGRVGLATVGCGVPLRLATLSGTYTHLRTVALRQVPLRRAHVVLRPRFTCQPQLPRAGMDGARTDVNGASRVDDGQLRYFAIDVKAPNLVVTAVRPSVARSGRGRSCHRRTVANAGSGRRCDLDRRRLPVVGRTVSAGDVLLASRRPTRAPCGGSAYSTAWTGNPTGARIMAGPGER